MKQVHYMLPHEMLEREAAHLNLPALLREWEVPPNWINHPVVSALGKWGRTQMGSDGFNRILTGFYFSALSGYALYF